eukprot:maker-scaffold438_size171652-snap-gene-0.32 protein:Tk03127 transcript:maker-scaffold438_size171652-snap-gene-0.32-mRNA-1 annotation:"hypothetical protein HMPREF1624_04291"
MSADYIVATCAKFRPRVEALRDSEGFRTRFIELELPRVILNASTKSEHKKANPNRRERGSKMLTGPLSCLLVLACSPLALSRPQIRVRADLLEPDQDISKPSVLFVRPLLDFRGRLLDFEDGISSQNLPERVLSRPARLPLNRGPVDFGETPNGVIPTAPPAVRLPAFGQTDLILKATAELRERDRNQESFIDLQASNAGLLPLAFEIPSALDLFPPLSPALKLD